MAALVMSNPLVKELLDPEITVFDFNWPTPVNWDQAIGAANQNLVNPSHPLAIPAAPAAIAGTPAVPASGNSDYIFSTLGSPAECTHFGGYVAGANHTHVRGYWRITAPVPPIYY